VASTTETLIRLIEDVAITGAHNAQVMYNATDIAPGTGGGPGDGAPWVLHHKCEFSLSEWDLNSFSYSICSTDQWRQTSPSTQIIKMNKCGI
jgi:hypothetical protein